MREAHGEKWSWEISWIFTPVGRRRMLSETGNNAARYMRVTALMLLVHASVLLLEGAWMMINHSPHVPHYHSHHVHDSCHSLAFVLIAVFAFYAVIILLISFTKAARSEQWAVRALGLPNMGLIVFMAIMMAWLAYQYNDHDEHYFVFNLQLACAAGFLYISYFLLSFTTNALVPQRAYSRVWVVVLGLPIAACAATFYHEHIPYHKWIGLASLVPYALTLLTSQRGKVTKALKKL